SRSRSRALEVFHTSQERSLKIRVAVGFDCWEGAIVRDRIPSLEGHTPAASNGGLRVFRLGRSRLLLPCNENRRGLTGERCGSSGDLATDPARIAVETSWQPQDAGGRVKAVLGREARRISPSGLGNLAGL